MDQDWFSHVPHPVFDEHPEYIELYDLAWNLAKDHVKHIPGMPQDPYIDESFCESRIWIWDTCFMTLFCKFSPKDFPGIESFRNLIDVLQDGVRLPLVRIPEGEPAWTGNKPGEFAHGRNMKTHSCPETANISKTFSGTPKCSRSITTGSKVSRSPSSPISA